MKSSKTKLIVQKIFQRQNENEPDSNTYRNSSMMSSRTNLILRKAFQRRNENKPESNSGAEIVAPSALSFTRENFTCEGEEQIRDIEKEVTTQTVQEAGSFRDQDDNLIVPDGKPDSNTVAEIVAPSALGLTREKFTCEGQEEILYNDNDAETRQLNAPNQDIASSASS